MKPDQFGKATPEFMGFKCGLQRASIAKHLSIQVFPSPKPGVGIGLRSVFFLFLRVFKPLNKNIGGGVGGPSRIYRPEAETEKIYRP